MTRSFVNIVVPFEPARAGAVRDRLQATGDSLREQIDGLDIIHFMSMTVIAEPGLARAYLLIEFSADIPADIALSRLTAQASPQLGAILDTACVSYSASSLRQFLTRHVHVLDTGLTSAWRHDRIVGLPFDGLPGMTVERIKQEEALARRIIAAGARVKPASALAKLRQVRETIWAAGDMKWAFEPLDAPFLGPVRPRGSGLYFKAALSLLWPVLLIPVAGLLSWLWLPLPDAPGVVGLKLIATLLVLGTIGYAAYCDVARLEASDPVDDTAPNPVKTAEYMNEENRTPLNLLITASPIKPDWFRPLALRFVLHAIGQIIAGGGRPGFLGPKGEIGTLHAGRWIVLPGTKLLLFIAHYDGSWLSYMQDFIDLQPTAPTAIWTNTVGFPPTRWLIHGGAEDGDRVTRWFHNQQRKTDFVYAASPNLTLGRIRANAAIRQGFATAETDREADAWLALFGAPSPAGREAPPQQDSGARTPAGAPSVSGRDALPQHGSGVPTLAYGSLSHFHHAACLILELQTGKASVCREWLRVLGPDIRYGLSLKGGKSAPVHALGLSASGLRKLGLDERDLGTFPVSFVDGMTSPARARLLGDDPSIWGWGTSKFPSDAVVLVYARTVMQLNIACDAVTQWPAVIRIKRIDCEVRMQRTVEEPFGFSDGVSQPVIPGTPAFANDPPSDHIVAPGEFVLGYRNETGRLPPTPSVALSPGQPHSLPAYAGGRADIGSDSTFLVVRQLLQETEEFDKYLRKAAAQTGKTADQIAAKMIGRWKNGSSLVRNPHRPGGGPDNGFRFARDDPDGIACPKGAHIRRANPRDSIQTDLSTPLIKRHRLLRRGRPYVDANGTPRGTLFMCLNADIERQFELVQQAWVGNSNFASLRDESDPLTGSAAPSRHFTIPTADGPECLHDLPQFVTTLGGGYFWMPGAAAVEFLAAG